MAKYDVIDAHVHTYKTPEIGRQALSGFESAGCCGTPDELVPIMEEAGIRLAVQCNMTPARTMFEAGLAAVAPEQVESGRPALVEKISGRIKRRNEWTCRMAQRHEKLIAFLSVDPIMGRDAMMEELLDKINHQGARGLKIHPGEGRFFPDDPSLQPVYEFLEKRGLPVISHGGLDIVNPDPDYTRPSAFSRVLERYPGLTLVIAHLGKNFFDESVKMAEKYANVFFDTSTAIPGDKIGRPLDGHSPLSNEEAVDLIRRIGIDRVMFGTDYPWYHPLWDLKRFLELDFIDAEKEALLGGNAKRILGL
ncbi:MAG: amidohydrolase [Deltaproteobacteria bacterium]|nr:amidohydrolase [Deltaproteobacteria bacterium]